ncbi:MAG TPA: type IV toxin-antitoxin system AbiEi family antitoxin domain-containing protein [Solirubrobacterales bacterium]
MLRESAKTSPQGGFSRTRGDDRSLAELARRQYGVVGRRQLLRAGWSEKEIDGRLRTGRLHRVHAGVYAVGHQLLLAKDDGWQRCSPQDQRRS